MSATDWLLTLEVSGRTLRYATQARVVDGLLYRAGLAADLQLAEGADDAQVSVVARELHALAADLDSGTASLAYLDADGAVVYVAGQVADPVSGAPDEAVSLRISRTLSGTALGTQVPDVTARVDETTWPITGGLVIGNDGMEYPVILGYPGWTGTSLPVCVVPAPIAQWALASSTTSYVVVSEDPDRPVGLVRVQDQENLNTVTQGTLTVTDLLGRQVRVANFILGGNLPASPGQVQLLGYYPNGSGAGVQRSLYDVVRYVLRRWGPDSVDWASLPQIRGELEKYNVDSWIGSTVSDPWVLIDSWIRDLGIDVRVSERGRYLFARRYQSDPSRVIGQIDVGVDAIRASAYQRTGEPRNELPVRCRPTPDSGWLSTTVVCGSRAEIQPAGVVLGPRIVESAQARRSYSRYGRRTMPGLDIDWTWDPGTALAIAERVLDEVALPATLVSYQVRPGSVRGVREGDEILVTDPDRPWVRQPAIVDEPPLRSLDGVVLSLRVPQ